jgi:hypothetical protein
VVIPKFRHVNATFLITPSFPLSSQADCLSSTFFDGNTGRQRYQGQESRVADPLPHSRINNRSIFRFAVPAAAEVTRFGAECNECEHPIHLSSPRGAREGGLVSGRHHLVPQSGEVRVLFPCRFQIYPHLTPRLSLLTS